MCIVLGVGAGPSEGPTAIWVGVGTVRVLLGVGGQIFSVTTMRPRA